MTFTSSAFTPSRWASSRIWARSTGSRSGSVRWKSGSKMSGDSSVRTKTRAAAPTASAAHHARGSREIATATAAADGARDDRLQAQALGQVEQPARHGLGDDAVVAPPGVAGDRQRQGDHDRGHREPDAEDQAGPPRAPARPCAPRPGASGRPAGRCPRPRPAPAARRWRPSSRAPRGSRGCGPARPGRTSRPGGWAPGPGRPSSTASSAAAPRCRPRPRRPPRPARRRAVAAPPAAIAGASAAVAAPDYRSPDRPPPRRCPSRPRSRS